MEQKRAYDKMVEALYGEDGQSNQGATNLRASRDPCSLSQYSECEAVQDAHRQLQDQHKSRITECEMLIQTRTNEAK